ncbi:DNA polymerase III subunit delta [Corynebacterium kutscheri]|uniref:DNA-directed DNA polymerase n=1 Tax=Corynebacterium kutscheri TaxID=35755 RepID=A0A0F6QZU6_9CORY|nr:DNA polymerase III, delta subunit [Corynebacterium kutscheri]VEH06717.1 DNA polymerase III subunit delta [Corynebacterium kutscheri]VEH09214.1 DNA polymerase III subunit delta [Corynebacterium kutscheri]VEH79300.1 DNA polymerase III subunit delta [Corynebacterium kutscheri]
MHLILGEEEFLAERVRRGIIAQRSDQVTLIRAGEVTKPDLIELLSPSLFAEDRIIVFNKMEDAGKEAAELILHAAMDPGEGNTLIIHHTGAGRAKSYATKLRKVAQVHEVPKVKNYELSTWVTKEFRDLGIRPTPDVVAALLEGVGSDLRELASAAAQLVSDTNGNVDLAAVRNYYQGVAEVSGFDVADLAVSGQTSRAVASLRRALQLGVSPVALATALSMKVSGIARLYSTTGRINAQQLAGQLGMAPFVVEKTAKVARRWSGENISNAVILMADLDATVKGQGGDPEFALEDAVRRIAEWAR